MIENLLMYDNSIFLAKNNIKNLGLNVSDNVITLCWALEKTKNLNGVYLECGVYKGSTILTAHEFCKLKNINKKFIGVDSFSGFILNQTTNVNDLPETFDQLFSCDKISKEHYDLAKERLSKLQKLSYLDSEYFSNPGQIIFDQAKKETLTLLRVRFQSVCQC